jgi:hypothetical protein
MSIVDRRSWIVDQRIVDWRSSIDGLVIDDSIVNRQFVDRQYTIVNPLTDDRRSTIDNRHRSQAAGANGRMKNRISEISRT